MTNLKALELFRQGRLSDCEFLCLHLLSIAPSSPSIEHLLALVAIRQNNGRNPLVHLRRAHQLAPGNAEYHCDLATHLGRIGNHAAAAAELLQLTKTHPKFARGYNNLGVALEKLGRLDEALNAYCNALQADPSLVSALFHLGNVHKKLGNLDRSQKAYMDAIRRKPDYREAWAGLASVLTAEGMHDRANQAHRRVVALPGCTHLNFSDMLLGMYYHPASTRQSILRESVEFERHFADQARRVDVHHNDSSKERRLRIGYLSPDLRDHPIGRLLEPVLAGHNRDQFEVYCYSNHAGDSKTARLKVGADHWRDAHRLNDSSLTQLIQSDKIDILVETAGHFSGNRLLAMALRPAPVQLNAFGWCGTTGISAINYRLTDSLSDPIGKTESGYVEELIRMQHCAWIFKPTEQIPPVSQPPFTVNKHVTFINLNNPIKTTKAMAALWSDILRALPGSRLIQLVAKGTETALSDMYLSLGISRDRLQFEYGCSREQYFGKFHQADIALDPFPFQGDNSTCDALWMGVPVISMAGDMYHSRRGMSHLYAVGLSELVAKSPADYVSIAVSLAKDVARLTRLREDLRIRMDTSPLCNEALYVSELESVYRACWRKWCSSRG